MKKYKNVLLSLGFIIAAPAWFALWLLASPIFFSSPIQSGAYSSLLVALIIIPYFVFFAIGIFFGWRNLKSEKPLVLGSIITLLGIAAMLFSVFMILEAMAWSA